MRDSKAARWTALVLLASAMFFGYIFMDILSPLQEMLQIQRGWDPIAYGRYAGSETFLNVFVFFLIFAGIILDKMGVRFTAILSGAVMFAGASLNYYAVSDGFAGSAAETFMNNFMNLPLSWWNITPFFEGMPASAKMSAIGFMFFGCGVEMAGITVSRGIVKWFKGKEMALAMGLEMATARVGTGLAIGITPLLCQAFGNSISMPILMGLILLCIGLLSFIVFVVMDKRRDTEVAASDEGGEEEEPFRVRDILDIVKMKGFWYIALLCVLFYSAVFPFLKFAPNLMINKFHVTLALSGTIPALLPFGNILLTPFFGNLYDRKGKGATIMLIGSVMLVLIHLTFSIPFLDNWIIALILIILLGIAFSLVPSAMWPSVPKIIPENKLGTAYALIFWVQNWGLMCVPYLIGKVLDKYCITGYNIDGQPTYDYTIPMLIFTCFGLLAIVFALLLKREDKKKGYGLELPNIKK